MRLAWREDLISLGQVPLATVAALAGGGSRAKIAKRSYLQAGGVMPGRETAGDDIRRDNIFEAISLWVAVASTMGTYTWAQVSSTTYSCDSEPQLPLQFTHDVLTSINIHLPRALSLSSTLSTEPRRHRACPDSPHHVISPAHLPLT